MKATSQPALECEQLRQAVRDGYAAIANQGVWQSGGPTPPAGGCSLPASGKQGGGCCGGVDARGVAASVGYAETELAVLPEGANMGLSCGNPTALASLKPGEVVLDLGSGGGFDCFLAGPRVGASGRVIGVDMTPAMLDKARRNVAVYQSRTGLSNVEFRLGEIEHLPVADGSVDAVISNCVLNLSPEKPQVWREIARVLRPGGRVAASDLALLQPLPEGVRGMIEALVGCVAGAVLVDQTRTMMRAAGLGSIVLIPKRDYIDAMTDMQDPLYRKILAALPPGSTAADYLTSLDITAVKPDLALAETRPDRRDGACGCGPGCC